MPFVYRLIINTIEPLFAVMGSMLAFRDPGTYLNSMTRHATTFSSDTTFLYTELGGAWLYFAFVEAVVMRMFDDLRLWRILCFGMLFSDFAFFHSAAQAVGGWEAYLGPDFTLADFTTEDWLAFIGTAPMVLTRILIVLGIGIKSPASSGRKKRQ